MVSVPSDFSVVGTVLALAIAIMLLSGVALYVAFRLRETLKDTKGQGTRAVKVAFLIGLLFLSGGVFYFFASGFGGFGGGSTQSLTTATTGSTSTTSSTSVSSTSTSSSSSSSQSTGAVTMQLAYSSSVNVGQGFYLTVSIFNSGPTTYSGSTVNIGTMSVTFTIVNATVCSPSCQSTTWSGGVVTVGNIMPGSTVLKIGLKAPASPAQFSGQATLSYIGESQPVSQPVTIRVSGRP